MTGRGAYKSRSAKGGPKTFGARIRAIRMAWKWSQGQLAERLNTDQQQISLYERDKALPSKPMQALLAQFFGVSLEALVSGEGFSLPDIPKGEGGGDRTAGLQVQFPGLEEADLTLVTFPSMESQGLTYAQGRKILKEAEKTKTKLWLVVEAK